MIQCTDRHAGKKVEIVNCTGYCSVGETLPAVLKSPSGSITQLTSNYLDELPMSAFGKPFPIYTGFMISSMLKNRLLFDFGISQSPYADMVETMWEKDYSQYIRSKKDEAAAYRTVTMLLQQSEYALVKSAQSSALFPHIYGTCGPLYLQEFCPTSLFLSNTMHNRPQFHAIQLEKTLAAINLLQLIQSLDRKFPLGLHMCDFKINNFGICKDGSTRVVDADTMFFDTAMSEILNNSQCVQHTDCNFFDCWGRCRLDKGTCHHITTNNNLHNVCRWLNAGVVMQLLSRHSMANVSIQVYKLQAVVEECIAKTSSESNYPLYKPSNTLLQHLIGLLKLFI